MTPAARLSAAIEVLDRILAGSPAEQALTNWGRASRYAGSGDRNAVRDLVYDALRCKRSFAARGGAETGRGLILGGLRMQGADITALLSGEGHAPQPVNEAEAGQTPSGLAALDCPDWLGPRLQDSLGADFPAVMQAMQQRAPVFLRVNLGKTSVEEAQAALQQDGIETITHDLSKTALQVTENARKIQKSTAYLSGQVELQDAASQAVVDAVPLRDGQRVLDYCSGGGGKALALAARCKVQVFAHDADPRRMRDLPARAKRADATISIVDNPEKAGYYDVILIDVPCSGSGSWRRDPQGKWALTEAKLTALCTLQAGILDKVAPMLKANGVLAYATCSMLQDENDAQIAAFLQRHHGWESSFQRRFTPLQGADGFFVGLLTRKG